MGPLRELLAVDERKTLEFFFLGLKDVSEADVDRQELLYNASVLAHYAQVSTHSDTDFPTPSALGAVFDHFVGTPETPIDAEMLETAGSHCLLMAGFFEDQMKQRHNVRWYARLGRRLLLPRRQARGLAEARALPRHPGTALRAVARAARAAEPRTARHAVPAQSADAEGNDVAGDPGHDRRNCPRRDRGFPHARRPWRAVARVGGRNPAESRAERLGTVAACRQGMRSVALVLVVLLTTSPLAEAYVLREAPEPCPMAAAMPDGAPCVTAPCPCDHSAPAAVAPQVAPTTLPDTHDCLPPAATARPSLTPQPTRPASGFPFAIDHPPDLGA